MRIFTPIAVSVAILLGAAPVILARQSPAASQEATCAIAGRVTIENEAASGVVITLQRATSSQPSPPPIARATTDKEGRFQMDNLPEGRYYLIPLAPAYFAPSEDRMIASGKPVTLTKGETLEGIELKLIPGGVITGRVTTAGGQPVVGATTHTRVTAPRAMQQMPITTYNDSRFNTDDRGVYRFYGLLPGSYLICAGCRRGRQDRGATAFDSNAPTYYPSSARENATEVKVAAGEEATGIDIRYRAERGHASRGVVAAPADFKFRPTVSLRSPGAQNVFMYSNVDDQSFKFNFEGLTDGEYELTAIRGVSGDDDGAGSAPRRVTLKGADMDGIELRIIPYGSVSGRFILAADSADCRIQQRRPLTDISPTLYREDGTQRGFMIDRPSQEGAFAIRAVEAGRCQLAAWLPHREWFLRSITQPGPAPANRPPTNRHVDISRQALTLQPGERKTGLVVTVAEGAAFLSGKVISSTEGASLPPRLRVYLVPAEPASADDALRYAEAEMEGNGRFAVSHLAPGRYYLLARAALSDGSSEAPPRPAVWSAENRAKLLREARAAKAEVELKACQRAMDYALRYESR
jgi:hypothetical protein